MCFALLYALLILCIAMNVFRDKRTRLDGFLVIVNKFRTPPFFVNSDLVWRGSFMILSMLASLWSSLPREFKKSSCR